MTVLLDHHLPHGLRDRFGDHEMVTAAYRGRAGLRHGDLLTAVQAESDALVTPDRGIANEQLVAAYDLAVLVLASRSSLIDDPLGPAEAARTLLPTCRPGRVYVVQPD